MYVTLTIHLSGGRYFLSVSTSPSISYQGNKCMFLYKKVEIKMLNQKTYGRCHSSQRIWDGRDILPGHRWHWYRDTFLLVGKEWLYVLSALQWQVGCIHDLRAVNWKTGACPSGILRCIKELLTAASSSVTIEGISTLADTIITKGIVIYANVSYVAYTAQGFLFFWIKVPQYLVYYLQGTVR